VETFTHAWLTFLVWPIVSAAVAMLALRRREV
jgi:hypothetical protein